MAHPAISVVQDGPVLTVTVDRPERRNAQTPSMWHALSGIAGSVPPQVRVVLLRGAGPDFSAGLDRGLLSPGGMPGEPSVLPGDGDDDVLEAIAGYQRAFTCWRGLSQLVVAVVQGNAIGAGFQLALAADLRICADDARFSMREVALGLVPDLGGIRPLAAIVGESRALEICVTARTLDAAEAGRLGIATTVVPRAGLDDAVRQFTDLVCGYDAAALAAVKRLVSGTLERTLLEQLLAERQAQAAALRRLAAPADRRDPGR